MKKYLLLSDGSSPHTYKWVKSLSAYFDVYIISFNGISDEVKNILNHTNIFDLRSKLHQKGKKFELFKLLPKVISIFKSLNPDFINAHYVTSYGTIAVIAKQISRVNAKLILSMWGTDILVNPFKNKLYFMLTRYDLINADLLTSESNHLANKAREISKKNNCNIMIFPFGVECIPKIGCEEKNYNYFFSNRALKENYNIGLVIDIFEKLWQEDKRRMLFIANDGEERPLLESKVKDKGLEKNVLFLGFLSAESMSEYYRKCGYFFSIPSSDSVAVSLLEAMAYGCIPLVSNIPSNLEWINDSVNGFVLNDDLLKLEFTPLENAFEINRELIAEKAIWSEELKKYVEAIQQ